MLRERIKALSFDADQTLWDFTGVRERSFALFLRRSGHREPERAAAERVDIFLDVRSSEIRLYPEVKTSLGRSKPRFKRALLTNGNTYPERCGLPDTFDTVVLGPAHGFEKPDRRAFRAVAESLELDMESIAHVGDDWDDVRGANDAGVVSVYVNRTGANPDFRAQAHHEVSNLVELEALLA